MMIITTHSKTEAECVARALRRFDCEVADGALQSQVTVTADDDPVRILTALEKCLGDNGIASINVTVNGRTSLRATV